MRWLTVFSTSALICFATSVLALALVFGLGSEDTEGAETEREEDEEEEASAAEELGGEDPAEVEDFMEDFLLALRELGLGAAGLSAGPEVAGAGGAGRKLVLVSESF